MKRKPVELISVRVKCQETESIFSVPIRNLSFRGWAQDCEICGSHSGVDMDIGICPSCKQTHPVTILMEY
jgi:hypothetical protein